VCQNTAAGTPAFGDLKMVFLLDALLESGQLVYQLALTLNKIGDNRQRSLDIFNYLSPALVNHPTPLTP